MEIIASSRNTNPDLELHDHVQKKGILGSPRRRLAALCGSLLFLNGSVVDPSPLPPNPKAMSENLAEQPQWYDSIPFAWTSELYESLQGCVYSIEIGKLVGPEGGRIDFGSVPVKPGETKGFAVNSVLTSTGELVGRSAIRLTNKGGTLVGVKELIGDDSETIVTGQTEAQFVSLSGYKDMDQWFIVTTPVGLSVSARCEDVMPN